MTTLKEAMDRLVSEQGRLVAGEVEKHLVTAALNDKDLVVGRRMRFSGTTLTIDLLYTEVERDDMTPPPFPKDYFPVTRYFTSRVGVA